MNEINEEEVNTQNRKVLEALQSGQTLTSLDVIHWSPAITRLSGRIYDLRHGIYDGTEYKIETKNEKNASGKGSHARYKLLQSIVNSQNVNCKPIVTKPGVPQPLFDLPPKSTAELWAS